MQKSFICYSKKDINLINEFKVALAPLNSWLGQISVWSDEDLEAGIDWHIEIQSNIKGANIIFLMLSPDFFAVEYIREKEIPLIENLEKEYGVKVIPIMLRYCDFASIEYISKKNIIPKKATPVTSTAFWETKDLAWLEVSKQIKKILNLASKQDVYNLLDVIVKDEKQVAIQYSKAELWDRLKKENIKMSEILLKESFEEYWHNKLQKYLE